MRGERQGPALLVALELLWEGNALAQLQRGRAQRETPSPGRMPKAEGGLCRAGEVRQRCRCVLRRLGRGAGGNYVPPLLVLAGFGAVWPVSLLDQLYFYCLTALKNHKISLKIRSPHALRYI